MQIVICEGFSVPDLEIQKLGLEHRIKRLEADLKAPLATSSSEQVGQICNLIILRRLIEVERSNLVKLNFEIEKRKQSV